MSISNKLKERRKELGLTMLEVAQKIGVSEATVSRWESGDIANMRLDKVVPLADALQVSVDFIIYPQVDNYSMKGVENAMEKSKGEMSDENRATRIARKIYDILSEEKCTVGEATEALRQVECVMSVAPAVQKNKKSEEMFSCVN